MVFGDFCSNQVQNFIPCAEQWQGLGGNLALGARAGDVGTGGQGHEDREQELAPLWGHPRLGSPSADKPSSAQVLFFCFVF